MRRTTTKKKKKSTNYLFADGIKIPNVSLQLTKIKPLTENQAKAFDAFNQKSNLLLHGLAGTGKTFMSMYLGLENVMKRLSSYSQVVIVRSVVPTRDIGFLPGDEYNKIKIYEAPYRGICSELFGRDDAYDVLKHHNIIDFITTSFIRGITINNAVVVVDECNNMNFHELDSIITRIGSNCQLVFCGDFRQADLPKQSERDGLKHFMKILEEMSCFEHIEFREDDILRSDLVKQYIIMKDKLGYEDKVF